MVLQARARTVPKKTFPNSLRAALLIATAGTAGLAVAKIIKERTKTFEEAGLDVLDRILRVAFAKKTRPSARALKKNKQVLCKGSVAFKPGRKLVEPAEILTEILNSQASKNYGYAKSMTHTNMGERNAIYTVYKNTGNAEKVCVGIECTQNRINYCVWLL